jgi:prevent-host-death family protein
MGAAVKNLYEAKTELSALVDRAANGEEFIIAKNGVPLARLVPLAAKPLVRRRPGSLRGKIDVAEDFDTLPEAELALWEQSKLFPTDDMAVGAARPKRGRAKRKAPRKRNPR